MSKFFSGLLTFRRDMTPDAATGDNNQESTLPTSQPNEPNDINQKFSPKDNEGNDNTDENEQQLLETQQFGVMGDEEQQSYKNNETLPNDCADDDSSMDDNLQTQNEVQYDVQNQISQGKLPDSASEDSQNTYCTPLDEMETTKEDASQISVELLDAEDMKVSPYVNIQFDCLEYLCYSILAEEHTVNELKQCRLDIHRTLENIARHESLKNANHQWLQKGRVYSRLQLASLYLDVALIQDNVAQSQKKLKQDLIICGVSSVWSRIQNRFETVQSFLYRDDANTVYHPTNSDDTMSKPMKDVKAVGNKYSNVNKIPYEIETAQKIIRVILALTTFKDFLAPYKQDSVQSALPTSVVAQAIEEYHQRLLEIFPAVNSVTVDNRATSEMNKELNSDCESISDVDAANTDNVKSSASVASTIPKRLISFFLREIYHQSDNSPKRAKKIVNIVVRGTSAIPLLTNTSKTTSLASRYEVLNENKNSAYLVDRLLNHVDSILEAPSCYSGFKLEESGINYSVKSLQELMRSILYCFSESIIQKPKLCNLEQNVTPENSIPVGQPKKRYFTSIVEKTSKKVITHNMGKRKTLITDNDRKLSASIMWKKLYSKDYNKSTKNTVKAVENPSESIQLQSHQTSGSETEDPDETVEESPLSLKLSEQKSYKRSRIEVRPTNKDSEETEAKKMSLSTLLCRKYSMLRSCGDQVDTKVAVIPTATKRVLETRHTSQKLGLQRRSDQHNVNRKKLFNESPTRYDIGTSLLNRSSSKRSEKSIPRNTDDDKLNRIEEEG